MFSMNTIPSAIAFSSLLADKSDAAKPRVLVFFITGNPGLINYYFTFLQHLHGIVSTGKFADRILVDVYGRSLRGFETAASEIPDQVPLGLDEQIESVKDDVIQQVSSLSKRAGEHETAKRGPIRVVLMGHSVGAYIMLEVIRRLKNGGIDDTTGRIIGAVGLFPTVTWISESKSGKTATPILSLPHAPWLLSTFAKLLTFFIPYAIVTAILQILLSFPKDAARTTAAFVKSRTGIHQALHMARDEMFAIKQDSWDDEIWGTVAKAAETKLTFLFGTSDHWVADQTRDELIKARGREKDAQVDVWKPVMEVEREQGWPHSFCIRHSIPVAERVKGYIEDTIDEHLN